MNDRLPPMIGAVHADEKRALQAAAYNRSRHGLTVAQIADALGRARSTVALWLNPNAVEGGHDMPLPLVAPFVALTRDAGVLCTVAARCGLTVSPNPRGVRVRAEFLAEVATACAEMQTALIEFARRPSSLTGRILAPAAHRVAALALTARDLPKKHPSQLTFDFCGV